MKRVSAIVIVLFLFFTSSLLAQNDYSPQYLFSGEGKPSISGFGGVDKSYIGQDGNVHQYYNASDFNSPEGTISFLFGGFGK